MGFVRDGRIVMTTDADFEAMAALAAAAPSATETGGMASPASGGTPMPRTRAGTLAQELAEAGYTPEGPETPPDPVSVAAGPTSGGAA